MQWFTLLLHSKNEWVQLKIRPFCVESTCCNWERVASSHRMNHAEQVNWHLYFALLCKWLFFSLVKNRQLNQSFSLLLLKITGKGSACNSWAATENGLSMFSVITLEFSRNACIAASLHRALRSAPTYPVVLWASSAISTLGQTGIFSQRTDRMAFLCCKVGAPMMT